MKNFNLTFHLNKFDRNPAIIFPGGKLNYRQYSEKIRQVAANLLKRKIKAGSYIAVLSENNWQYVVLILALIQIKAVAVPLNIRYPNKRLLEILIEIKCKKVFISNEFKKINFKQINSVLDIDEIFADEFSADEYNNNLEINYDQPVTILFTSGSNGKPKAVLHTFGNHYYSALGSNKNIVLGLDDCWMITLPFYHIAGIAILFRTLIAGSACYIPDPAKDISSHLKNQRVTHLSLVPTQLHRWLSEDTMTDYTRSLKAILIGGSQIPQALIKQSLQRNLPVFASYGSTEMSSQITTSSGKELRTNPASSGKILSHRELKINHDGEILVRGKTLGLGYVVHDGIIKFVDSNGWFHSGDLGHFDDNQNLIVTGRRDNMFISGGENIHPEEIENHLRFIDNIFDACVVDVPDAEYGARPVAFIRMNSNNKIDETYFKNYLIDKIAGFKVPVRFYPWPEGKDSFKPDRKYLKKLARKKVRI